MAWRNGLPQPEPMVNVVGSGSFCVWAQPMGDDVTLQQRLSTALATVLKGHFPKRADNIDINAQLEFAQH